MGKTAFALHDTAEITEDPIAKMIYIELTKDIFYKLESKRSCIVDAMRDLAPSYELQMSWQKADL